MRSRGVRVNGLGVADKKSQLDAVYKETCINVFNNYPACKSEVHAMMKCQYVDTSASVWEKIEDDKDACEALPSDEEREACIKKAISANPCVSVSEDSYECTSQHKAELKQFSDAMEGKRAGDKVAALLESWGLDPEDYYPEDY